jgi:hypothetical protein
VGSIIVEFLLLEVSHISTSVLKLLEYIMVDMHSDEMKEISGRAVYVPFPILE